MKIEKFQIENFKSVKDSDCVKIEKDLTILLGKNEAGKTSILKALESFRGDFEYDEDDLSIHSNVREEYDKGNIDAGNIPMVTIYFQVEPEDQLKLEEISAELRVITTLICTKYYDDHYEIKIPELKLELKEIIDDEKIVDEKERLKSEIYKLTDSFRNYLDLTLSDTPYSTFKEDYIEILDKISSYDDFDNIDNLDYHEELKDISVEDEDIQKSIDEFIEQIANEKREIKKISKESDAKITQILDILPNFMYFSTMDELEDQATWSDLKDNPDKYKTLRNLLKLSDIKFEEFEDFENRHILTDAVNGSAKVTGLVNESWTQEKVDLMIYVTNDKVTVFIKDNKVKQHYNPSARSQGFQWFLSFYINFRVDSEELENTIILLDDPGVYLHASGQKDLIKTLEEISNSNQIVISTHSPFMIDTGRLERIRLVSNLEDKGTTINKKFYESDYDAFAPIRASIGMSLGNSLFFDRKTLMVEGITDDILIRPMAELLYEKGNESIDTSKTAILSVNSADRAKYFIPFLLSEEIEYVILLDNDQKGRDISKELIEKFGDYLNIMNYGDIGISSGDVILEDLIDFQFYLRAVNNVYKDMFKSKLGKDHLEVSDIPNQSFRGIKNFFRTSEDFKRLDKAEVAYEIVRMIRNGENPSTTTIANFSKLFKLINEKYKS